MSTQSRTATAHKAKVLLVDDHPIVRQGLAQLIDQEADLMTCGQTETVPESLQAIEALKPDVAVVDISLRNANGLELIKDIRARHSNLPIMVLSMHDETLYAERALRAGARGYIMKQEATETVIQGIRKILSGQIHVSAKMSTKMLNKAISGNLDAEGSSVDKLSDRELEVFKLIGEGLGTRQIAEDLHLSIKTVEAYRAHIKDKLDLKNAAELVHHAIHWVQNQYFR